MFLSVKAVFSSDPEIAILEGKAQIHFIISGPLTHIIEENCVQDTSICDTANITVPNNLRIRQTQNIEIHDFTAEVPLADVEDKQFIFSFWMYDGEDMLYSEAAVEPFDVSGGNYFRYK